MTWRDKKYVPRISEMHDMYWHGPLHCNVPGISHNVVSNLVQNVVNGIKFSTVVATIVNPVYTVTVLLQCSKLETDLPT